MEISVIIPVYNVEKYIERCLRSILDQTFQDFEIILVNDGSTDRSMEVIELYAARDNRIVIIQNEENIGTMCSREAGYRMAKGKYFIFCDSDDFLPGNALEILYSAITESNASMVIGSVQYVTNNKKLRKRHNRLSFGTDPTAVYKSLLIGEMMQTLWGKIYDRELFDRKQYENFKGLTNGEDAMLLYQVVSMVGQVKLINEVVYYYFINTESETRKKMTIETLRKRLFSFRYISTFIREYRPELSEYLRIRETKMLESLLMGNLTKKEIKQKVDFLDLEKLSQFRTVRSCQKGINGIILYLKINSRLFRLFIKNTKRIKKLIGNLPANFMVP